jgi:hypothetical protein
MMKKLKMLGVAVVAVTALMAFGAGTASATPTALCEEKTTVNGLPICEPNHLYPAGTRIHAELEEGTRLLIATPLGVVECKKSTIDAFTEWETEIPFGAIVNALTFGECTKGPEEVEVKTIIKGTLDIEVIDIPEWTHDGTLTLTGTEITVLFKGSGAHCRYDPGHTGILTGGPMATIDWFGPLVKTGGNALCPAANANWNGFYTVTSPEPLWISM